MTNKTKKTADGGLFLSEKYPPQNKRAEKTIKKTDTKINKKKEYTVKKNLLKINEQQKRHTYQQTQKERTEKANTQTN